jgi:hypothetical protein
VKKECYRGLKLPVFLPGLKRLGNISLGVRDSFVNENKMLWAYFKITTFPFHWIFTVRTWK